MFQNMSAKEPGRSNKAPTPRVQDIPEVKSTIPSIQTTYTLHTLGAIVPNSPPSSP